MIRPMASALALLPPVGGLRAQHIHLNAGALSTAPGSPVSLVNASGFIAASGYVFNMVLRTNGPANGLYDGSPTFTSVGSNGFDGPPAAPGSLHGPRRLTGRFVLPIGRPSP